MANVRSIAGGEEVRVGNDFAFVRNAIPAFITSYINVDFISDNINAHHQTPLTFRSL